MNKKISVFILSSLLSICPIFAQTGTAKQAIKNETDLLKQPAFFQGLAISVEVGAPLAHLVGADALTNEAGVRFNFKNKYFPIAEVGYSKYDTTNEDTQIHFKTKAPYFRLGMDINMLKNKLQENRLFAGFRVGYSTYKFDIDGPNMTDPVWGDTGPLFYENIASNRLWLEIVFGLESEILKHFHMGFSLRYKHKLHEKTPLEANPYFIPGFGHTDNGFRATYNLYFDLTRKIKNKNID